MRGVLLLAFGGSRADCTPSARPGILRHRSIRRGCLGDSGRRVGLAQEYSDTDQSDGFDVAITGGLDGIHKPGRPVPVNIVVRAEKLLAGELAVESEIGQLGLRHRLEIEVPGGSTKCFIVTVPTSAFANPRVTIRILTDNEPIFSRRVELRADSNLEFVGVMTRAAAIR